MNPSSAAPRRAILIASRSVPKRSQWARALADRGFDAVETADEVDTLHAFTHHVLSAFVVATDAGGGRGVDLLSGLVGLDRQSPRPKLLIAGREVDRAGVQSRFGAAVTIVDAAAPVAAIVAMIEAACNGRSAAPGAPAPLASLGAAAAMQAQVDAIDRAMALVGKVVEMIEQNRLPGPVVPSMLAEAMTLFANPNVTFETIAAFAKKHQTVSARLLAVANGALYARGSSRITTLESAIARLGLTTTRDLVQAIAARAYVVGKDVRLKQLILDKLKLAYLVSLLAGDLSRLVQSPSTARVQMVALFHNIGQVFLLYTLALMSEKSTEPRLEPAMAELASARRTLDVNRLLCKLANVPPEVVAVFSAADVRDAETGRVIAPIHQAMWFADRLIAGVKPDQLVPDEDMTLLGLKPDTITAMIPRLPAILEAVESYGS